MNIQAKLTKKQGELLMAFNNPDIGDILFGGGWRWGKTRGMCEIVTITCYAYPWIKRLIWRRERDDLKKTTLVTMFKVFRNHGLIKDVHYSYNAQDKIISFPNWSWIYFKELKLEPSDPEFDELWSLEITWFWVDECQQVPKKAIDVLKSRCTEMIREYNLTPKWILTCNPDKWRLYQEFIKPQREGKLSKDKIFIQSLYTDNPHIDHEKYRFALKDANKVTRERLLFGNWDYDDNPYKVYTYDNILALFTNPKQKDGEKYMIVDVAGEWDDRAIVTVRVGLTMVDYIILDKCNDTQLKEAMFAMANKRIIKKHNRLYDWSWLGWWLSGLWCPVFHWWAAPVSEDGAVGEEVDGYKRAYANLRNQCYIVLNRSLVNGQMRLMVDSQDERDKIIQELDVIQYRDVGKDKPLRVIPKDEIKKIIGRSPDRADTIMMRMYFELNRHLWPMIY